MSKKALEAKPGPSIEAPTEITPLIAKDYQGAQDDNVSLSGSGGLSVQQLTILIAGQMAGSGILALPRALVRTGWVGVPLVILMCAIAVFSGKRFADCWTIIAKKDLQMRSRKRNPYAIIADQALGKIWSTVASVAIIVTLFGVSVVYLLLAAQIIENVFLSLMPTVHLCIWYLIVVAAITPLILVGSPEDFVLIGTVAFGSAVLACILYLIQMMSDVHRYVFRWGFHSFREFLLALGTIMFAFSGASIFPIIQNDMGDKIKFRKSVEYSFIAVLTMYLPIAVGSYAVYGESVTPNVSTTFSPTPLTLVANILMVVHFVSAFIITVNPVCQELEELYNITRDSTGWRIGIRLSTILGILFIGESIPRFYTILALLGGSSVALLTFVLPSLCYLKLIDEPPKEGRAPSLLQYIAITMVLSSAIRALRRINRSNAVTQCCRRATYSTESKARYYTKKHEWVAVNDNIGTIGISQYAQDALGEVVFAQLPDVGQEVSTGDECGALESVKAAGEVYTPVSGTVTEKNTSVESTPSLINKSCYDEGWLFRVKLSKPEELKSLMDQTTYDKYLEESH